MWAFLLFSSSNAGQIKPPDEEFKYFYTYITYISSLVCDPLTQHNNRRAVLADERQNSYTGYAYKMAAV